MIFSIGSNKHIILTIFLWSHQQSHLPAHTLWPVIFNLSHSYSKSNDFSLLWWVYLCWQHGDRTQEGGCAFEFHSILPSPTSGADLCGLAHSVPTIDLTWKCTAKRLCLQLLTEYFPNGNIHKLTMQQNDYYKRCNFEPNLKLESKPALWT